MITMLESEVVKALIHWAILRSVPAGGWHKHDISFKQHPATSKWDCAERNKYIDTSTVRFEGHSCLKPVNGI